MKQPADPAAVGKHLRMFQAPWVIAPLVAIALSLLVTVGSIGLHLRQDLREIRDTHFGHLVHHAANARVTLASVGGDAMDGRRELLLRQLFPETSPFVAALVGQDRAVIASTVPAWRGADIRSVAPAVDSPVPPGTPSVADAATGSRLHVYLPWTGADAAAPAGLYVGLDIHAALQQQVDYVRRKMLVVGTLVVLGGLLLGWWLRNGLQRPLRRLQRAVQAIQGDSGALDRRPVDSRQLQEIAESIDRAADDLQAKDAALAHHRQSLAVASACSTAMLRAGEGNRAAQAICATLVDFGFSAAWIGLVEDRVGPGMRLVARAGECAHLAAGIDAVLPANQVSLGVDIPAGRVRRVPLIAVEAAAPDWLNLAARNGCVEMMLVPLAREGRAIGVLTLLGRTTDAFDEPLGPLLLGVCDGLGVRLGDLALRSRQRELQQQLDHERSLLRAVIDSIPEPMFFKDRASVYLGCNPAFARLANRPEAEIVGGTAFDVFPGETAVKFHKDDGDVLADGGMHRAEEWIDYPDGRQVLLELVKTPYRDATGRVLGLVGISRDITQQYEAMQALERERGLFVAGPTVVFRWAPTDGWPVLYVSPNVLEQFGYTPGSLAAGRPGYAEIVHPADRQRLADEVEGHLAGTGRAHFDQRYRLRHADGRYRWVFDQTTVIRDPGGDVVALHGYVIDITATVDLEVRLGERIKELNGLYGIMRILAGTGQDIHAVFKAVVDAIPSSFRYPGAVVHLTHAGVAYASGRFATSLPQIGVAWRSARGTEGRLDVGYAALPDDVDEPLFLPEEQTFLQATAAELARFVDRAHLLESERATAAEIEARERRFRAVADSSRDFIYEFDPASGRRRWYGSARAALGYDPSHDETFASDWLSYLHPDDVAKGRQLMEIGRGGAVDFDVTYRVRAVSGDWQYWRDRGRVVDEDGGAGNVVGSCADVTGIVVATEHRALVDRRLRLGERLETLGLLAKGMTTDLNRKLMVVQGYAGILAKRLPELAGDKAADYLDRIRVAADGATAIVREIDRFSDVSDQRAYPIQVKPLIDTCVALLRPTLPASLTIDATIAPGLPSILVQQAEAQHVVLSLCLHVRHAIGESGRLSIAVTLAELPATTCGVCGQVFAGQWIEVAVTSGSVSIPAVMTPSPAQTGGDAGHSRVSGELGLQTAHSLAPHIGGHLVARLVADRIAGYALYLRPVGTRDGGSIDRVPGDALRHADIGRARTALAIGDDSGTLELVTRQLELFGFDVAGFVAVADAVAYWQVHSARIALAVIDENLHEGRGSRVAARMREAMPRLPLVIVSGYYTDATKTGVDHLEPAAFLAKPYRLQELDRVLGRLLEAGDPVSGQESMPAT